VSVWEIANGKRARRLQGAAATKDPPHHVVFTANGRFAVSLHDRKLRLWDLAGGKEVYWVELKDLHPNYAAVSADGRYLASCNWRGSVTVWKLNEARAAEERDKDKRQAPP
jgi:WD40 repeat protein